MRPIKFRRYDKRQKVFFQNDSLNGQDWQQYTGLKDKNGKEIYEGDIVTMKDISASGQVREFPPRAIRWEDTRFNISRWDSECECEIIGNIYENPELLEQETL